MHELTTEQQISKLAASIVEHQAALAVFPATDAQWVIENTELAIQLFGDAVINRRNRESMIGAPKQAIPSSSAEQLGMWRDFYACFASGFGLEHAGPPNPALPEPAEGFGRLVVVKHGITQNAVLETIRTRIKVYSDLGDDLDSVVPTHERTAETGDYAILTRDRVEPDEEPNTLPKQIAKKKIATMTLLERLILELFYFHFTHEHLDVKDWTLCAGSRDGNGDVPHVGWSSESSRFYIRRSGPDTSRGGIRARVVRQAAG